MHVAESVHVQACTPSQMACVHVWSEPMNIQHGSSSMHVHHPPQFPYNQLHLLTTQTPSSCKKAAHKHCRRALRSIVLNTSHHANHRAVRLPRERLGECSKGIDDAMQSKLMQHGDTLVASMMSIFWDQHYRRRSKQAPCQGFFWHPDTYDDVCQPCSV